MTSVVRLEIGLKSVTRGRTRTAYGMHEAARWLGAGEVGFIVTVNWLRTRIGRYGVDKLEVEAVILAIISRWDMN